MNNINEWELVRPFKDRESYEDSATLYRLIFLLLPKCNKLVIHYHEKTKEYSVQVEGKLFSGSNLTQILKEIYGIFHN